MDRRKPLQSKRPLQRKTPLKAKKGLVSRAAIRRTQPRRKPSKWQAWREQERLAVMKPAWSKHPFVTCRSDRHPFGEVAKAEHAHHAFGRSPEPWASYRELLVPLCGDCHALIHDKGDPRLREKLRRDCIAGLAFRIKGYIELPLCSLADDPMKWWRDFSSSMDSQGILPPTYNSPS